MNELNLGFSNASSYRKIFVKASDDGSLWHFWDADAQRQIPIKENSLTGYLKALKVREYQSNFGQKNKLQIYLRAKEDFYIQSGLESWFSKSLLSSLATLNLIQAAITIRVKNPPNSQIVFSNLFIGEDWVRPDYSWKETGEPDWLAVIESIRSRIRPLKDPPF